MKLQVKFETLGRKFFLLVVVYTCETTVIKKIQDSNVQGKEGKICVSMLIAKSYIKN